MTAVADPALGFWLRHVAAAGGLSEPDGDATYVVLPPPLRDAYRLPEELRVTADPDVAREDGATLLTAGHSILAEAAERVLASGDTGHLVLARPASVPPGHDALLAAVREAFPVGHGRIDLSGEPAAVLHPVIRVGALAGGARSRLKLSAMTSAAGTHQALPLSARLARPGPPHQAAHSANSS